jgi:hypothetical protein
MGPLIFTYKDIICKEKTEIGETMADLVLQQVGQRGANVTSYIAQYFTVNLMVMWCEVRLKLNLSVTTVCAH